MKLTTYTTHIILEKETPELRNILGNISSDVDNGFTDYLMWWNEDNTGNIQITNTENSINTLAEDIEYIEDEDNGIKDFSKNDINTLKVLLNIMIDANRRDITCIEYGV